MQTIKTKREDEQIQRTLTYVFSHKQSKTVIDGQVDSMEAETTQKQKYYTYFSSKREYAIPVQYDQTIPFPHVKNKKKVLISLI